MNKTIIIAEAGVNHNGDINLAFNLVEEAKEAGADYVKFQTFVPKNMVSKFADKANYQKETTNKNETQLEMLKKLSLQQIDYYRLREYCNKVGIGFLSSPFDFESIDYLNTLHMDYWKIPSGEITNLPYLEMIGKTEKPVILSSGMSEIGEIIKAVAILKNNGSKEVIILHCNTDYPTSPKDVNLLAMNEIKEMTGCKVGYSDHTIGIEIPIAAVALGAEVIEKHFTLDKEMKGPDHKASLEPNELKEMIMAIRNVEISLGNGHKKPSPSETNNIPIVRKSIVAKCDINKGEMFTVDNLTVKRPGTGLSPMKWYEIMNHVALRDYKEDETIDKNEC